MEEHHHSGRSVDYGARQALRVHVLVFDGADELDFVAPQELFSMAAQVGAPIESALVTVEERESITAAHGTQVCVQAPWSPQSVDLVLVAGGGFESEDVPGVLTEIRRGLVPEALRAAHRPGLTFASVCTGAVLLSAVGLTKGRPCTTHHMAKERLTEEGAQVVPGRVVDDGDLVTAGGITSGLDLGLWLLERQFGAELALQVEMITEYERRGTVWRRRSRDQNGAEE